MKDLREIEKLSLEDLRRIGDDGQIPVPEDWKVRLPERKVAPVWIAAAAAVLVGVVWFGMNRQSGPKDTFDDPYLAYAAVEEALLKVSVPLNTAAAKVAEAETQIDRINYWK